MADEPTRINATRASGGSRGTTVRNIMIVSIVLVVVAFVAVYFGFR